MPLQQFVGSPGQHAPDFSALAPDPWDHHAIVAGRCVAHPGDDRRLGLFLAKPSVDRSASRSARISSTFAAEVQMPLEKTFRPFFSWTTQ